MNMDAIENEARRAFALAINCLYSNLRPDAEQVEFNYVHGQHYELRMSVDGYAIVGSYDSGQENADLFVEVLIVEVAKPDGTKTQPNFEYSASKSELGENYAELYEG